MALKGIPSIGPRAVMGKPTGATNIVSNGGATTDTVGWANVGTGVVSRNSTGGAGGTPCFEIDVAALNDGTSQAITGNAVQNKRYTLSLDLKAKLAGDVGKTVQYIAQSSGGIFEIFSAVHVLTADWIRVQLSITWIEAAHTGFTIVIRGTVGTVPFEFLMDNVQYEEGPASPYTVGTRQPQLAMA